MKDSASPIGVLFNTDRLDRKEFIGFTKRLDELGAESLWLPELFTREPFATAGYLLAATEKLTLATGIANVYARDAVATVAASSALAELSDGRFILGLGVSNPGLNKARGHQWVPPVTKLREYLTAMKAVKLTGPQIDFPVHIAAHGPKMQAAAAELADGVNTYIMPVEHVAATRAAIGPASTLNTMLMCLDEADPTVARGAARKALAYYTGLDYYHRAWRTMGLRDADFENGGSDRLIDAIVAWGDIRQIRARVAQQFEAGASRVVVVPLGVGTGGATNWRLLEGLLGN